MDGKGVLMMIVDKKPYFKLETKDLNYIIKISKTGQLEHLYFGAQLIDENYEALEIKLTAGAGSSIEYERDGNKTFLDLVPMEYSGIGKGDFRLTPLEVKMPNGTYVTDFIYDSHEIVENNIPNTLPFAQSNGKKVQSLVILMKDEQAMLEMKMIYTIFFDTNVITRRVVLTNRNPKEIIIRKIMSMMMDLAESDYDLMTFDGGWIKEAHKHIRPLSYGTYINDSTTGASSNRHNPGIILAKKGTHEDYGVCIGINLIYSGNHYEAVQISNHGLMRIMNGINPHCFEWPLKENESFETPESVLTYSDHGFNQLSHQFHGFINTHIIPRQFQDLKRPVVLNS